MAHNYNHPARYPQIPSAPQPLYPYSTGRPTSQPSQSQNIGRYHRPTPAIPSYKQHIYTSEYSSPHSSPPSSDSSSSTYPRSPATHHQHRHTSHSQQSLSDDKKSRRDSRVQAISIKDLPNLGSVDLMDGKNASRPTRFIASIECPPRRKSFDANTTPRQSPREQRRKPTLEPSDSPPPSGRRENQDRSEGSVTP